MEETTLEPSPLPDPDFAALVESLAKLSRNHLLFFRIEVGRKLSKAFYGHDPARYRAASGVKDSAFRRFLDAHRPALADLGLTDALLRQSLLAFFVVKDLPRALVDQLVFSHVIELTRVDDPQTRQILATAAVDNGWTGEVLANAVLMVRAGRWPDGDLETPGLQPMPSAPTELAEPVKAPLPGRVVTRFEKTAEDLSDLMSQWAQVPVEKLTPLQTSRVREALAQLEGRVAALKRRLG